MAGDASLADQVAQLRRQPGRHPGHGGGQGLPQRPPLRGVAAEQLAAARVEHRCAAHRQQIPQPLQPLLLQGGQQRVGQGTLQHPMDAGHGHLHAAAARLGQQGGELGISQGHMGAHQHESWPSPSIGAAAAEGSQALGIQGLGRQRYQPIEKAGGALEQEAARRILGTGHQLPHHRPEGG